MRKNNRTSVEGEENFMLQPRPRTHCLPTHTGARICTLRHDLSRSPSLASQPRQTRTGSVVRS